MKSVHDHSKPIKNLTLTINEKFHGKRVDLCLREWLPYRSRTYFKEKIQSGAVTLNNQNVRASTKVKEGDCLSFHVDLNPYWIDPLSIKLNIILERDDLIAVNKESGQLIHPTGSQQGGTLLNALHARHLSLGKDPAFLPQVVHRLDQDTSGVVIFAKGKKAASYYGQVFENRQNTKQYLAVLEGELKHPFTANEPIGNDFSHCVHVRQWVSQSGKRALSHFKPIKSNTKLTLSSITIETGRLHQIRVHAAYHKFPIFGDSLYNPNDEDYTQWTQRTKPVIKKGRPERQLLHAWKLSFPNPKGNEIHIKADIPKDFIKWAGDLVDIMIT